MTIQEQRHLQDFKTLMEIKETTAETLKILFKYDTASLKKECINRAKETSHSENNTIYMFNDNSMLQIAEIILITTH